MKRKRRIKEGRRGERGKGEVDEHNEEREGEKIVKREGRRIGIGKERSKGKR